MLSEEEDALLPLEPVSEGNLEERETDFELDIEAYDNIVTTSLKGIVSSPYQLGEQPVSTS